MAKVVSSLLFILALGIPTASAQLYIGGGPNFLHPQNKLSETNNLSSGFNIILESRTYCKFWYGLRADYFAFAMKDDIGPDSNYFQNAFYISPQVRFNIFGGDCYNDKVIPYLQAMFTFSSIGNTDERSRFGLGGAGGGGVTLGFSLFDLCWLLDLNALWSAPNSIARADKRNSIQSINFSLTLSVGL